MKRLTFLAALPLALALALAVPGLAFELPEPDDVDPNAEPVDAPVSDYNDALYGFDPLTGGVVLGADTGYVYCPAVEAHPAVLAIHPDWEDRAITDLEATVDSAAGLWALADGTVVTPQYATGVYATDRATKDPASTLPTIAQDEVVLVQPRWPDCIRLIPYHLCRGCYRCPQGCYRTRWGSACSIRYAGTQYFKLCQYTGQPWDVCWERSLYICTATGFPCNDCTGNPMWMMGRIGWSCWNGC